MTVIIETSDNREESVGRDVIWLLECCVGEYSFYTIVVLTSQRLHIGHFQKRALYDQALSRVLKEKEGANYATHFGSTGKSIDLADITRVENHSQSGRDEVAVYFRKRDREEKVLLGALPNFKLFRRLHRNLSPEAPIETRQPPVFQRLQMPVILLLIFLILTGGAMFVPLEGKTFGEHLGTTGLVLLLGLETAVCLGWGLYRAAVRPEIQYFEPAEPLPE